MGPPQNAVVTAPPPASKRVRRTATTGSRGLVRGCGHRNRPPVSSRLEQGPHRCRTSSNISPTTPRAAARTTIAFGLCHSASLLPFVAALLAVLIAGVGGFEASGSQLAPQQENASRPLPQAKTVTPSEGTLADSEVCARRCECKWRMGKRTVLCVGAQLTRIPQALHKDTQVLNVSGNILQTFESREFQRLGYTNLQRLFASRCGLLRLADDSFQLLHNLVDLDLSANFLTRVPTRALSDCLALRKLSLSNNPIEVLHDDAFLGLSRLGTLVLTGCQLKIMEAHALRGLRILEFLRLSHNLLTKVPPEAFAQHLSTQHLHGIDLEENPWICDCKMRLVREWMSKNRIPLSLPPKCTQPARLQGISWQALDLDDFACAPELAAIDTSASASEGDNATLRCEVDAQPPADILWSIRGRPIQNMTVMSFGNQMYIVQEEHISAVGFNFKASVLIIVNVMAKDAGVYSCEAVNRAGNVSASATLIVHPRADTSVILIASVEIGGVVLGVLITIVVLVGAVYLVMQQYAHYCEERDALEAAISGKAMQSGMTTLPSTEPDLAGQGAAVKANDAYCKRAANHQGKSSPPSPSPKKKKKPLCYETMAAVQKNNAVAVDLIDSLTAMPATVATVTAGSVTGARASLGAPADSQRLAPTLVAEGNAACRCPPARRSRHTPAATRGGGHSSSSSSDSGSSSCSSTPTTNSRRIVRGCGGRNAGPPPMGNTSGVAASRAADGPVTTGTPLGHDDAHRHTDMAVSNSHVAIAHGAPAHYHDRDGTIHLYRSVTLEGAGQPSANVVIANLLHQSAFTSVAMASSSAAAFSEGDAFVGRTGAANSLVNAIANELEERIASRITQHLQKTAAVAMGDGGSNDNNAFTDRTPMSATMGGGTSTSGPSGDNGDGGIGPVAISEQPQGRHASVDDTSAQQLHTHPPQHSAAGNGCCGPQDSSSSARSSITSCNVSANLGSITPRSVAGRAVAADAGQRRGSSVEGTSSSSPRQPASRDSPDEGLGDEVREEDGHRNRDVHGGPYC